MKPLLCTHRSSAPPDRVWAMASDFARAAGRIKAITKVEIVTPGPVGAGTPLIASARAPPAPLLPW